MSRPACSAERRPAGGGGRRSAGRPAGRWAGGRRSAGRRSADRRSAGRWAGGRWAGVAGGLVVAALVLVPAAPAFAASANIVITAPSSGQSFTAGVTSASVPITGTANIGQVTLEKNVVTDVQVTVALGGSTVYSCAHSANCGAGNGQPGTNFSFAPVVTRNGPYSVSALVSGTECNVLNSCVLRSSTATTSFNVGVHPAAPRNVRAQVNGDRSVTVSWSANPEPDLVGYQILRGGSGGAKTVNPFLTGTTWTDTGTAAAGGDFGYTVVAFRPGADGSFNNSTALSTSSAVADANVPAPPVPTTTVGAVGQPVVETTTTTVAVSSTPSGPDLSAFLNQATQAGVVPVAPPKVVAHATPGPKLVIPPAAPSVVTPDTYVPNLPYSASATAPALAGDGGGPQVPLSSRPVAAHHGRSLLYPVAGGMFLCVLGLVLRNANRKSGPSPLEPVGGGAGGGGPGSGSDAVSGVVPASTQAKSRARAASLVATGAQRDPGTDAEPALAEARSTGARSTGFSFVGARPATKLSGGARPAEVTLAGARRAPVSQAGGSSAGRDISKRAPVGSSAPPVAEGVLAKAGLAKVWPAGTVPRAGDSEAATPGGGVPTAPPTPRATRRAEARSAAGAVAAGAVVGAADSTTAPVSRPPVNYFRLVSTAPTPDAPTG